MIRLWGIKSLIVAFTIAVLVFISLQSPSVSASSFTKWSQMSSGTTSDLQDVWGSGSSYVFAVGSSGIILHYDGSVWSPMSSGTTSDLQGVWGSGNSDVFAVGSSGIILHYGGSVWSPMSSGITSDLQGVWGSGSSDVFAVGSSGIILHYDGSVWSPMSSGITSDLQGVWGSASTDVFAVGSSGTILHYDGSVWGPMSSGITSDLQSVWESASTDVFAVGSSGTILHYDGSVWGPMSSGTTSDLNSVSGRGSTDVFAVGSSGIILHYDGSVWSPMTRDTISELNGVWGFSSFDVFAAGRSGTIVRYIPPIISSVSLDHGDQGATLDVIITGENFTGASEVSFGAGIAINGFTVPSSSQIAVNITIVAGATPGVRDITVTTPGGTSELPDSFTVKQAPPIITSISPNQGNQGTTLDVIITGKNFTGTSEVSFGTGIVTNSFTVLSSSQIAARITIDENATTGAKDVSAATHGGTYELSDSFTVIQAIPMISSVSLDHGDRGATLDLIITGKNFTGASQVRFGAGIAINGFTVLSSSQIAVNITILAGATPGARGTSVMTPGGTSELPNSFTIKQAPPIITSVSPNQGNQGATIDVVINGGNLDRVSALSFGTGVSIDSFTNRSSTQIAARITIDENTTPGARDILVDTPGGTSTLGGGFTVKERPLGTLFIALTWLGIGLAVVFLGFILNILRRKRAAGL